MPWRQLLRLFTNNEQFIQKLSETAPIRYAARMSVYWFMQAKEKGTDKLKKPRQSLPSDTTTHLKGFSNTFMNELNNGFKEIKNENNKKK